MTANTTLNSMKTLKKIIKEDTTMKNKNNRIVLVKMIKALTEEYLMYIENFGNECAYTDSILEQLAKTAAELEDNLF